MPHGLTRLGSMWSASAGRSETRLCWTYVVGRLGTILSIWPVVPLGPRIGRAEGIQLAVGVLAESSEPETRSGDPPGRCATP